MFSPLSDFSMPMLIVAATTVSAVAHLEAIVATVVTLMMMRWRVVRMMVYTWR